MEKLTMEGTLKAPTVNFDPAGTLEIEGRSIPENSVAYYEPLLNWLDSYADNAQPKTTVNIKLEYFNTSSSKCIYDIFKKLMELHARDGKEVVINWFFEDDDDDMQETGEDYQEMTRLPFNMESVEELFPGITQD